MSFSIGGLISINIFPCFKFKDLATRVAIIPIVEFGEIISSKVQDLATRVAIIPIVEFGEKISYKV